KTKNHDRRNGASAIADSDGRRRRSPDADRLSRPSSPFRPNRTTPPMRRLGLGGRSRQPPPPPSSSSLPPPSASSPDPSSSSPHASAAHAAHAAAHAATSPTAAAPSRHPAERPTRMDARGHVMTDAEQRERWKRAGKCPQCGLVETHRLLFGIKRQAQTVPNRAYKGICLNCHSMTQAKSMLNEQCGPDDFDNRGSVADMGRGAAAAAAMPDGSDPDVLQRTYSSETPQSQAAAGRRGDHRTQQRQQQQQQPQAHPSGARHRQLDGSDSDDLQRTYSSETPPSQAAAGRRGDRRMQQQPQRQQQQPRAHPNGARHRQDEGRHAAFGGDGRGEISHQGRTAGYSQDEYVAAREAGLGADRRGEFPGEGASCPPSEPRGGVPRSVRTGGFSDDVSVMSEISLDPSIVSSNNPTQRSCEREESLGRITEGEESGGDFGPGSSEEARDRNGSRGRDDAPCGVSGRARDDAGAGDRPLPIPGTAVVERGMDRILERKLAANAAAAASEASRSSGEAERRGHSDSGIGQHQQGTSRYPGAGAAPSTAPTTTTTRGAHRTARIRPGSLLDQRMQEKLAANAAADASNSHARTRSDGVISNEGAEPQSRISRPGVSHVRARSSEDVTAPGAHRVNDDSLLRRKLERENATTTATARVDPDVETATDDAMSASEAQSLVSDCSSCGALMVVLRRHPSSDQVAFLALAKLRDRLAAARWLAGSRTFLDRGWANTMMTVASSHASDAIVQAELLHTLWSIVASCRKSADDLVQSVDLSPIAHALEVHAEEEPVQAHGCGLLASLAIRHASWLMKLRDARFVRRLTAALAFEGRGSGDVADNALKALFRLSSAHLSSEHTSPADRFAIQMGRHIGSGLESGDPAVNAVDSVLGAMERHRTNASLQIHGNRLLCNIFSPELILDPDYVDILIGRTLEHLEATVTSHQRSRAFCETSVCLLSKMSRLGSDTFGRDAFLFLAVDGMRSHPDSSFVSIHGCRCVANTCARSPSLSLSRPAIDSIPEILSRMDAFGDDATLQSEACAALSAMCINFPSNKEQVQSLGGVDKIDHVLELGGVRPRRNACVALTTLAVDPVVLSEIREKGILAKVERLLEVDSDVPAELQRVVGGLLGLAAEAEGGDRDLAFPEGAGEDETLRCLRANLRSVATPDFVLIRVPYLRSNAVEAMRKFPTSAGVHEYACKLLACAFASAAEEESSGRDEVSEDEVSEDELLAVTTSLAQHKCNSTNATAACSAIRNLCVLLSSSSESDRALDNASIRAVSEVVNIYREDEEALEQATGALQALCALRDGLALNFETESTIGLIVAAMNRFSSSSSLHKHAIGILGSFFSVSNHVMDFVNDDLVTALLEFIKSQGAANNDDDEDAINYVDTVVNIILVITNTGFQGVTTLLRNDTLIDTVVGCMWKWPEDLSIQSAGISILSNVALDNFLRADICQRGGTSRIVSALDRLHGDPSLTCKAYAALSNLISGADVEVLRAPDAPAPEVMVRTMRDHPEHLPVQAGGANALWALSSRSDSFKDEIVNRGGARAVADAMGRFVGSKHMQSRGLVVIWSLSVSKQLKVMVGRCSIEPVVNGLCAHMSSEKICEDALGCLKCLSTATANKEQLEENGAIDLIYCCEYLEYLCEADFR
ncbi:hypothetical protein ACHAWF_012865, partial [Thalassiosira exigua]